MGPRVVSLLPGATEIAAALGVQPAATSHECDHPPAVRDAPTVTRSRVDADAAPGAIDDRVLAAERAGGMYEIDLDVLASADPDVVLTQGVCEVCAVDSVLVEEAVAEVGLDCRVLALDAHSLADVLDDVERIGRALGRPERARALRSDLEDRVQSVAARAPPDGPRVAVLDWTEPVMAAGHWVPGLLASLGATYGMAKPGARSRPREWAAVRAYDPDVLVVAPCGFDLDRTLAHADTLTDRPGWSDLAAVRDGRVFAMDGDGHVNRPGPRLVDSLEHLAGLLYPDRFERPPPAVARGFPGGEPLREGAVGGRGT